MRPQLNSLRRSRCIAPRCVVPPARLRGESVPHTRTDRAIARSLRHAHSKEQPQLREGVAARALHDKSTRHCSSHDFQQYNSSAVLL